MKNEKDYQDCDDCKKRLYSSKRRAREATAKAHNRIRIYRCPKSIGWHVTDRRD